MQRMHPLRLQYEMFGPGKSWSAWIAEIAERVRDARQPASPDNIFLKLQEQASEQIVRGLEAWRNAAEKLSEETFHAVYGAPALQAALGIDASSRSSRARPPRACFTLPSSSRASPAQSST